MVFHFMRKVCSRSTFILLGKGEMSRFLQQTRYNWILNILETPKCANQFRYKRYWNISVLNVPPKQPKWVCYCWQASILIGTLFLPSFHIAFWFLNMLIKQPKWVWYCWKASILIGILFLPSFHIADSTHLPHPI